MFRKSHKSKHNLPECQLVQICRKKNILTKSLILHTFHIKKGSLWIWSSIYLGLDPFWTLFPIMKCKFPPIFFNAVGFKGGCRIHDYRSRIPIWSGSNTTTNALKTTYLVKHLLFDSPISLQSAHRTKLNE